MARKDPSLCRFKGCREKPAPGKRMCREHWPLFERIRRELDDPRDRQYVVRRDRRAKRLRRDPDLG